MTDLRVRIIASDQSWIDPVAIEQLHRSTKLEGIAHVVGMPDLHVGRGIAVGAAFWSSNHVHPHLVGSDIGCGMGLWSTELAVRKFRPDAIERRLHGLEAPWPGDVGAMLHRSGLPAGLAGEALGTIGGGNHFAELLRIDTVHDPAALHALEIDESRIQLMVHSGSRGLGHAILENQLARSTTAVLEADSPSGRAYLAEHDDAMRWAILNREIIALRICERLGMRAQRRLDICHNSVTPHQGGWLHRKGAAPADKGAIVIPGSRGDLTYLVLPRDERADEALHSLAHGAGRKWSRSEAKAKLSARFKVADLERTRIGSRVICEDRDLIYEEAPQAYKDIHQVVRDLEEAGLIHIVATLRPLITYKTRRA